MNKEKFTTSSSSAPTSCSYPKKLCNGKCVSGLHHCCPIGKKSCNKQKRCVEYNVPDKYCY